MFDSSRRLSRCWFAERVVMARAICSHNGPLYTDKVSRCARRRTRNELGGRELHGIDSVKLLSNLGDVEAERWSEQNLLLRSRRVIDATAFRVGKGTWATLTRGSDAGRRSVATPGWYDFILSGFWFNSARIGLLFVGFFKKRFNCAEPLPGIPRFIPANGFPEQFGGAA